MAKKIKKKKFSKDLFKQDDSRLEDDIEDGLALPATKSKRSIAERARDKIQLMIVEWMTQYSSLTPRNYLIS